MGKVYSPNDFFDLAKKATKRASQNVQDQFHLPVIGSLKCAFARAGKGSKDLTIRYNTVVGFEWRFQSEHVTGIVSKSKRACDAMKHPTRILSVPRELKPPLFVAYVRKILAERPFLPAMQKFIGCDITCLAIAASKPLTSPLEKIVSKRRDGTAVDEKRSI